jgi:hypothetical protein
MGRQNGCCNACERDLVEVFQSKGMEEDQAYDLVHGGGDAIPDKCRGEDRYSLGIYAGFMCDHHWRESGYRDEPASAFDPSYAGESYDGDDW